MSDSASPSLALEVQMVLLEEFKKELLFFSSKNDDFIEKCSTSVLKWHKWKMKLLLKHLLPLQEKNNPQNANHVDLSSCLLHEQGKYI